MKLQHLLPFAAVVLLAPPIEIVHSNPAIVAYAPSANQVYQTVNQAVVTVFAGGEIGSGSIITPNGLVITNNHVVRGVSQVYVRTANGRQISGQVVGTDTRNDLALIQLNTTEPLPTVPFAVGTRIQSGQPVIAIGSPYGRPGVMTQGTFTATRSNGDLQSRVILEPGNSGGPLLNTQGEMIGINKAILESSRGSNTGISISTSAAVARNFVERVRPGSLTARNSQPYTAQQPPIASGSRYGGNSSPPIASLPNTVVPMQPGVDWSSITGKRNDVVVPSVSFPAQSTANSIYESPYAAATLEQFSPGNGAYSNPNQSSAASGARLGVTVDIRTMIIQQVQPGTAGASSGLQVGDRLLAVNGTPLNSFDQLQAFMNQAPPAAAFTIARRGRSATVRVRF